LEDLKETQLSTLLPQLDAIVVDVDLYVLARESLFAGFSPRILVDSDLGHLKSDPVSLTTIHHLRLRLIHLDEKVVHVLSTFVSSLPASTPLPFRTIHLDHTDSPATDESQRDCRAMEALTLECKQKGIEVVHKNRLRDPEVDSYISHEFWRRQRMERQRVAQE
jgi:hypothetical protein